MPTRVSKLKVRDLQKKLVDLGCKRERDGKHHVWRTPGGKTFPLAETHGRSEQVSQAVLSRIKLWLRQEGIKL